MKEVFLDILAPILIMVALGAIIRRRFGLDLTTLNRLNIYLFVPAFIFDKVVSSHLPWQAMGGIFLLTVAHVALLGAVTLAAGLLVGAGRRTLAAVLLAVMFYNSGNIGLPLAELAFPAWRAAHTGRDGAAVQAFVLMAQNLLTFTLGLAVAVWGGATAGGQGLRMLFRMPMVPALAAALVVRWLTRGNPQELPAFLSATLRYLGSALVPVALVTLGAQIASNRRRPRWGPVSAVLVLRLLYAPVQMLALLWVLGRIMPPAGSPSPLSMFNLWPWPAQLMVLTAAVPTAVNTLLLTLELEGEADLAADAVFWTTICSGITLTGWLIFVRAW